MFLFLLKMPVRPASAENIAAVAQYIAKIHVFDIKMFTAIGYLPDQSTSHFA